VGEELAVLVPGAAAGGDGGAEVVEGVDLGGVELEVEAVDGRVEQAVVVEELAVEVGEQACVELAVVLGAGDDKGAGEGVGDEDEDADLGVVDLEHTQGLGEAVDPHAGDAALAAGAEAVGEGLAGVLGPGDVGAAEVEGEETLHRQVQGDEAQAAAVLAFGHAVEDRGLAGSGGGLAAKELAADGGEGLAVVVPVEDKAVRHEGAVGGAVAEVDDAGVLFAAGEAEVVAGVFTQEGDQAHAAPLLGGRGGEAGEGDAGGGLLGAGHGAGEWRRTRASARWAR
jgi:hypothetical protein